MECGTSNYCSFRRNYSALTNSSEFETLPCDGMGPVIRQGRGVDITLDPRRQHWLSHFCLVYVYFNVSHSVNWNLLITNTNVPLDQADDSGV
jgi:hypothetical protein